MKIGIANDHQGYKLKNKIIKSLKSYEFIDYGSDEKMSDHPIYAFKIGEALKNKEIDLGIVICGTGIGISIACNKVSGIACAKVSNVFEAKSSRQHNNANVIALSGKEKKYKKIIKTFIETPFSNVDRYQKRIDIINNYK